MSDGAGRPGRFGIAVALLICLTFIRPLSSQTTTSPIDIAFPLQTGFWVPTTYEPNHGGAGPSPYYAVDFRYAEPQAAGQFDWTPKGGQLGRVENAVAAHAGVLTLVRERFFCSEGDEVVQSTLKIVDPSGQFATWYSHLETIRVGDAVVVFNTSESGINLRTCASTTCALVTPGGVPNETVMRIVGGPERQEGYTWWRIRGVVGDVEREGWAPEAVSDDGRQVLLSSLFRIDDEVFVQNGNLNLRESYCVSCPVIQELITGVKLRIIGGPVRNDGYTWWNVIKTADSVQGWVMEALDDLPALPLRDSVVASSIPKLGKRITRLSVLGGVSNYGCARSGAHLHFMVTTPQSGTQELRDAGPVRLDGEIVFPSSEDPVLLDLPGLAPSRRIVFSSMPRGGMRGDLNLDEHVNSQDLQLMINVILGTEREPRIGSRSDINVDGATNSQDLQLLINIILRV